MDRVEYGREFIPPKESETFMKLRFAFFSALILFLASLLAGCGGGGGSRSSLPPPDTSPGDTEWTVMVYMNADNDLDPFSVENVNQMVQVGSTYKVKIVVQWDRAPAKNTTYGDWTDTRRYEIERGNKKLISDMGELDMGNPQVMKDFIAWAETAYPAKHYCLVIWDHGAGWRSRAPGDPITRSISYDATSDSVIGTRDLPGIMTSAPSRIDVVAMDACLMQMAEVSYEMRDTAGYLVASESSQTGQGYVYDQWLGWLAAEPSMDAETLSKTIAEDYVNAYLRMSDISQSVVDLSKMAQVRTALDGFARALALVARTKAGALSVARNASVLYSADDSYRDMLDYAKRATDAVNDTRVSAAYPALASAVKDAVVYEGHSSSGLANSSGISIWLPSPTSTVYHDYRLSYGFLQLPQDTYWDEFLAAQVQ